MDDVILLIRKEFEKNEIGEHIAAEKSREVWATISSVSRQEWSSAGRDRLKPWLMVKTPAINYDGEEIVEVHGVRYAVYRTYHDADSDEMELYLAKRVGD